MIIILSVCVYEILSREEEEDDDRERNKGRGLSMVYGGIFLL